MTAGILIIAMVMQAGVAGTAGPPLSARPHDPVIRRTADATVLGTIGAADADAIEAARLATTKASSSEVRAYASTLLRDHTRSLAAGGDLAKDLHITRLLPADSAMARAHKEEMLELNTLSGAAFDQAFVYRMVHDHEAAIARVSGPELAPGLRSRVKEFVRDRLPVLRGHQRTGLAWLASHP